MARQVRIEYPGACYHVMARGDRREDIYLDEEDRELFYRVLREANLKFGIVLHGYVLMSNHYHLLLETPESNLVATMKWIQNTYTRRFNVKHRLWGHLFGGRYKAIVVDDQQPEYFSRILDYIHLNPARIDWKGEDQRWIDYPYSSLLDYTRSKRLEWLRVGKGFQYLGLEDTVSGRRKFLSRLEDRIKEEGMKEAGIALPENQSLQSTLSRGWQFGTEAFREKLLKLVQKPLRERRIRKQDGYRGVQMRDYGLQTAERLIQSGANVFKLEPGEWQKLGKGDWRKCLLGGIIQEQTGMTLEWICQRLVMGDRAYACRGIGKMRDQIPVSPERKKLKRSILMSIMSIRRD